MKFKQALEIVSKWIEVTTEDTCEVCAIEDKPYGWVFYFNAKSVDPNDTSTLVCGNAPIIFDRIEGEIRVTGTAYQMQHYLEEYEKTLPEARLLMKPEKSGFISKSE